MSFESKDRQRARVAMLHPPRPYPFPIPTDKLAYYQYSGGMASELLGYCAVDDFLAVPAVAILKRALPYLFEKPENASTLLERFAKTVAGYNYREEHALDVFLALHRVMSFVRVAADAEELAGAWIETEIRDRANPFADDFAQMQLAVE